MPAPYEQITCPFCFKKFNHKDVHFRVSEDSMIKSGVSDIYSQFRDELEDKKGDVSNANGYSKVRDEQYTNFWKGLNPNIPLTMNPVITKDGKDVYGEEVYDKYKNASTFETGGMFESVIDKYRNETEDRLCPYCHNSLPKTYGQYETKFISVIGIEGCGKTVFLSQLLKKFKILLADACSSRVILYNYAEEFQTTHFKIKQGNPLPASTTAEYLNKDLILIDLVGGILQNPITLVLYDIAGRNCVNENNMKRFGPFIRNADAFIMLLDPYQFITLRQYLPDPQKNNDNDTKGSKNKEDYKPDYVIDKMFMSFLKTDLDKEHKKRSSKPIALTFAQSDLLLKIKNDKFSLSSNIFKPITYETKGFQKNQHFQLEKELESKMFINKNDINVFASTKQSFESVACFAVSSLGIDTKIENEILLSRDDMPHRIEEPLLWILYKLGHIREASDINNKKNGRK